MEFDFTPRPLAEWRSLLAHAPRATLLQSWPYARAMRLHNQVMSRMAAVTSPGGEVMGIFQTQDVSLGPFHVVQLHQGPCWFDPQPDMTLWHRFLECFTEGFPRRLGRMRRIMPSLPHAPETADMMAACGFRPKSAPYETIWLDLEPDLESLRSGLKSNWRNALSKAERADLTVDIDDTGQYQAWFLRHYTKDKMTRGYGGPSPAFLRVLMQEARQFEECLILRALDKGRVVAGILVLLHGCTATYQAGWTGAEGRELNAHHLLLWHAIGILKERDIRAFDLGGIHPSTAEGVTRFKLGLGGERTLSAGLYA